VLVLQTNSNKFIQSEVLFSLDYVNATKESVFSFS